MQIAGLHRIHTDFGFGYQMTEGDNTVMSQQTAKYLLKLAQEGKINFDEYVHNTSSIDQQILLLFEIRYKNQLKSAALSLQEDTAEEMSFMDKWNQNSLQALINATVYYLQYWALNNFLELINGQKELFAYGNKIPGLKQRPEVIQ